MPRFQDVSSANFILYVKLAEIFLGSIPQKQELCYIILTKLMCIYIMKNNTKLYTHATWGNYMCRLAPGWPEQGWPLTRKGRSERKWLCGSEKTSMEILR